MAKAKRRTTRKAATRRRTPAKKKANGARGAAAAIPSAAPVPSEGMTPDGREKHYAINYSQLMSIRQYVGQVGTGTLPGIVLVNLLGMLQGLPELRNMKTTETTEKG